MLSLTSISNLHLYSGGAAVTTRLFYEDYAANSTGSCTKLCCHRSCSTERSTVAELRNLCRERKIPFTGNRNSLVNRLRDSGSVPPALNDERTQNQPVRGGHDSNATPAHQDHEANDSNFTEGQLSSIRRLIQESIANASREIGSVAAMAAVQALKTANSASNPTTPVIPNEPSATPRDQVPMGTCRNASPFQDIPATYVKDIQSGEVFELSKLLPKNLATLEEEDNLVLTLDNSVVRVAKKSKSASSITDIEQWTTAFTSYMSIFTHKFPQRSQELLQYLSLIRYAARVHKGLGWAIYDYKFRQKASLDKTRVWSEIDNQLWLTIFTIAPSAVKKEYPLFNKGPQPNSVSTGGEMRGTCHAFNRTRKCNRDPCSYRHICNRCSGPHPGCHCPIIPKKPGDLGDRDGDKGTPKSAPPRRK